MKYKKARALSKILSVLLICAVIAVFTLGASQAAGAALKPDETQGSGVSQKIGDAQETDALHGTEVSQLPGSLWRSDDAKEHDITHGTGTTRVTGTVQEAGFLQESGDAQETGSAYKAPVGGFSIEQTEALPFSGEFGRVSAIEPPGLLILMCNLDNRVGYLIYYSAPDPLLTTREHVSSVQAEMMSAARAVWYDFPLFAADDHDSLELLEMELNKAIMHFSDESVRVDHVSLWLLNTPRRLQFGD